MLNTDGAGEQYVVEGIGYDFIPDVLSRDPKDIDHWIKTADEEAFEAVRKLMRLEGLLVGGSSGSALSGAMRWLKSEQGRNIAQTKGTNVVVLLPDGYGLFRYYTVSRLIRELHSIRNYMSKPWFLKMALEAEPSPLAKQITAILKDNKSEVRTASEPLAQGIAARTQPNIEDRPDASDEISK